MDSLRHLAQHDPILAPVIAKYGPPTLQRHKNYYQELVESIIGQQLSVKAAASIRARFVALYDGTFPDPSALLSTTPDELRAIGFSRAKATYVQDLAQHVIDGTVKFDHLDTLTNEEIVTELTTVKGIGEWTVHMFLIFCMGRTDVLAWGDLGIKNGIKQLYRLEQLPTKDDIIRIAAEYHWHPYESIACWYIWKSLDNSPS